MEANDMGLYAAISAYIERGMKFTHFMHWHGPKPIYKTQDGKTTIIYPRGYRPEPGMTAAELEEFRRLTAITVKYNSQCLAFIAAMESAMTGNDYGYRDDHPEDFIENILDPETWHSHYA